jgi:hypothetical protein
MKEYDIASILWEDHYHVSQGPLPNDPDDFVLPTLSVGIILEETDKTLLLVSDIERYEDREDVSYTIIYKATIIGRKTYGTINIVEPRKGVV